MIFFCFEQISSGAGSSSFMQHVVFVQLSSLLLPSTCISMCFCYITIHFTFNTDWMANTEIVLDPNNSYKEVVVYFYHGDSFTSSRVTMRIEQPTKCFVPLQTNLGELAPLI